MNPTIYLALTHDWELRGDGSGDIEQIQFAPMRRLIELYKRYDVHATFFPEMMQQMAFRRYEAHYPELKSLADSWDEHVLSTFHAGHDIQLHIHSRWQNATYEGGHWQLSGNWSIVNYDRDTTYRMLYEGKKYLNNLLHPLDSRYSCLAFRAGLLAAAPSDHLFTSLVELGIQLDVSIVGGLWIDNDNLRIDYRNCEETFRPFYPNIQDARKVSDQREAIVCVPLNHFYGSRRAATWQNASLAGRRLRKQLSKRAAEDTQISDYSAGLDSADSKIALAYEKLIKPLIKLKHFVSDTGRLNHSLMQEMLCSIRQRTRASGLAQVPVVLTNHPKDIRDWSAIERFVRETSQADDIKFVTLIDVARKLEAGEFQIRVAR